MTPAPDDGARPESDLAAAVGDAAALGWFGDYAPGDMPDDFTDRLSTFCEAADALRDVNRITERVCTRVLDVVNHAGGSQWTAVEQLAHEVKRVREACVAMDTARAALLSALTGKEGGGG